ncbi:MAG: hypothetical protein K1X88_31695 [Nannocystaceae bacterium]|nr:hypothetical protein [Nannocystaceae bacterium]
MSVPVLVHLACFAPEKSLPEAQGPATESSEDGSASGGQSDSGSENSTGLGTSAHGSDTGAAPCDDEASCDDHNPCTVDGCGADGCSHAPVTDDPACSCTGPGDCTQLPPDDTCRSRSCDDGVCGQHFADAGTRLPDVAQRPEDCRVLVCDGRGGSESVADDDDVPDDGLECTLERCEDGAPSSMPADAGTRCAAGSCNDAGACTGCSNADDCGGEQDFCQTPSCTDAVCGVVVTDGGTALPDGEQTTGDCQRRECDGGGNIVAVAANTDLPPDDDNDCTEEACHDGVAAHDPLPADTACGQGVCDGDGGCVECNDDAQCPAAGVCTVGVCIDHACSVAFADPGASCDDGLFCTASDSCNGAGACLGGGNPCPGADGDGDCSEGCNEAADACTANDVAGSACNDGLFCTASDSCNGAGACVGSGNPCPGADGDGDCSESCNEAADACSANDPGGTDCGACRMCSNGVCGASFCDVGEKCCAGDDECIPTNASCP